MKTVKESILLTATLTALFCLQEVYAFSPADCNGVTVICLKGSPATLGRRGATYLLTQDVVSSSDGFRITADNVTLDGQGHTLTYTTGTNGAGVYALDRKGITVKHLTLKRSGGWGAMGFLIGDNHSILSNTVGAIRFYDCSKSVIKDNIVNGGLVIHVWHTKSGSNDNLIEQNTFVYDNSAGNVIDNFINYSGSSLITQVPRARSLETTWSLCSMVLVQRSCKLAILT